MTFPEPRLLTAADIDAVSGGLKFAPISPFPCFPQPTVCPPPPSFEDLLA